MPEPKTEEITKIEDEQDLDDAEFVDQPQKVEINPSEEKII